MNHSINLGALCERTGIYTLPMEANKQDIYQCIGCKDKVFLKKGLIKRAHYCHYPSSNCTYYIHSSESEIHKNAKLRIKSIFEQKCEVSFLRSCCMCKTSEQFDIPVLSDTSKIILEFSFKIENDKCVADVAYIDIQEPLCMIEVYHTHLTSTDRRVEPWFEVNATHILETQQENNKIQYTCVRKEHCDECIKKREQDRYTQLCSTDIQSMNDSDLEFYVRYHLGQREFKNTHSYTDSKTYTVQEAGLPIHHPNKLSYHDEDDINDRIINMFSNRIANKRVIIRGWKGSIIVGIVSIINKKEYTFSDLDDLPSSKRYSAGELGSGTRIKIIMDILKRISTLKQREQAFMKMMTQSTRVTPTIPQKHDHTSYNTNYMSNKRIEKGSHSYYRTYDFIESMSFYR
jgi:hypothetical protein